MEDLSILVYNTEIFERSKRRYIGCSIFFVSLIIVLLLSGNYIGVFTLCLFLGWYCVFSIRMLEPIRVTLTQRHLSIGTSTYARSSIQGFVLEIHKHKEELKNLVIIIDNKHSIFSFHESCFRQPEQTREFLVELWDKTQLLSSYPQTTLQLLMRKLKL